MDNNSVKYHPYPSYLLKVMVRKQIFAMCKLPGMTLNLAIWPWVLIMIWMCDILSRSNMAVRSYGQDTVIGMCALCTWPCRHDLGSRSLHTLGLWTIIVWNIIQIQHGNEELWPGHIFWVCVHCDLDIIDMTFGQGHDTPLGHGQQLCEILSRSNMAMRNYGQDTYFGYVCTVTSTL